MMDREMMEKDMRSHAADCGDLCGSMFRMLQVDIQGMDLAPLSDDEVMTINADCTMMVAALSRCQTLLMRCT